MAKVVGSEVIEDAIAFFQAFQGMEEGFRNRAGHVDDLLSEAATRFVLVASPRRDTLAEAVFFAEALGEADIAISALIVNRMHPRFAEGLGEAARERATTLAGTAIGDHYANLADFQLIAGREEDHLDDLVGKVGDADDRPGALPPQRRPRPRRPGRAGRATSSLTRPAPNWRQIRAISGIVPPVRSARAGPTRRRRGPWRRRRRSR